MSRKENGITLVALAVTIIVMLILSGVAVSMITDKKGPINETYKATDTAQKESILEKIEADLYSEKIKKGRKLTEQELIELIADKDYGTVSEENGEYVLTTKDGEHKIFFSEIIGWE